MLNKKICKKCRNSVYWDFDDEYNWHIQKRVLCISKRNSIHQQDVHEIPDGCIYKLEHTVLKQRIAGKIIEKTIWIIWSSAIFIKDKAVRGFEHFLAILEMED